MGGGDLNLKKSWHPSTMRNMEKVWKAEQKHDQEKKRIAELQREIRQEKAREDIKKYAEDQGVIEKKTGDVKLDWMYKGPGSTVDREEYLLGKAIDKNFEQLQKSEQQGSATICVPGRTDSCLPGSIFAGGGEQVDIARKLQEDPLLIIRKKEIESRSQLLKNPVKMKQLKELIKEQKSKKLKKHKKEKKKKVKKRSKKDSSSEDSDSDLDAKLLAKYQKLKEKLGASGLAELQKSNSKSQKHRRKQSSSVSEEEEEENVKDTSGKKYGLQLPASGKSISISTSTSTRKHMDETPKTSAQSHSQVQQHERRKLTEEEKERRRKEMLANAAWRKKEREENVARYREADRRDQSQAQDFSDNFLRQQLSQAAAQSSVASRIKSNINNIQRSGGSMDKNFARR